VFGLEEHIAELASGHGLVIALAVAALLGLRHATDPDHLTAVSTLVLADERRGARRATALGMAWGLGHAAALIALGLPVVLASRALPEWVHRGAEMAIGAVIIVLAVRLLQRWRRGYLHVHAHEHHDGTRHAHPHVHEHAHGYEHGRAGDHEHAHAEGIGRTPRAAFGIGLVHGVGGSAGVGILLIGAISNHVEAVVALTLFALASAVSMAAVSGVFGRGLTSRPARRRFATLTPAFGMAALLFGAWYILGAAEVVPYVF
jgi:ABC-type nickel/cobalt efflux system permease component RcnA